uniref:Leucine-rich repeat domain-containing protein n=1 Tax=Cacopsylla melanoneura TaxID=428564 RepID=A0A8D9EJ22_9HEMI
MSDTLLHVFSIFPIQDNIAQYLGEEDLKNLSSLGGIFANFYFDFNRELNLDQYDDEICSKFRKIENLHLRDNIQKQVVPKKVLSVLVSLEVPSIDNKIINLKECKKLKTLRCKDLGNLDNNDFPLTLKKLALYSCNNISKLNLKHLINLKEIDYSGISNISVAINNFPVSLEKISLTAYQISGVNIKHLINLKEIHCSGSNITSADINNFPVSLERISLRRCLALSDFNIKHLVNLKEIDCSYSPVTNGAVNNFPVSLGLSSRESKVRKF